VEKWQEPHRTQLEEIAELSRFIISDQITDFIDMLDALPAHEIITREKRFLDLVALGMSAAALTLSSINTAKISALENKIALNNKRVDHLVNITALHEQHFKAVDQKLDDITKQLALLIMANKAHFAKLTDFMQQKFSTAIKISERLIHTAYKNRLAPGALHHGVLLQIIDYVNQIADKSENLLMTDLTKTCLGSFYLADPNSIQTRCQFSIGGALEKIFRLDSNMYVVYSLGKINTNHVCPKTKSISAIQISYNPNQPRLPCQDNGSPHHH
jgi:hypothetical protein